MPAKKTKPEINKSEIGVNPFISGLEILVNKRQNDVINKFGEKDVIEFEYEKTPFTRVFMVEGGREQMDRLSIRGKEMYLFMIYAIDKARDYIWIDRAKYMKRMGIKSENTFREAFGSLADNGYIHPHRKIKDLFWVNPHYFFKGSRINQFRHKIKVV